MFAIFGKKAHLRTGLILSLCSTMRPLIALVADPCDSDTEHGKADECLPMRSTAAGASADQAERQLGQMIRRQNDGDLLNEPGQEHERNPQTGTERHWQIEDIDDRGGGSWPCEV